jgi:hypothetical protein
MILNPDNSVPHEEIPLSFLFIRLFNNLVKFFKENSPNLHYLRFKRKKIKEKRKEKKRKEKRKKKKEKIPPSSLSPSCR